VLSSERVSKSRFQRVLVATALALFSALTAKSAPLAVLHRHRKGGSVVLT
jgi:hypothetical protein